jgi:hypothetical protein
MRKFVGDRTAKKEKTVQAKIVKGQLVITLPIQTPTPSASSKTLIVASSHGVKRSAVTLEGKTLWEETPSKTEALIEGAIFKVRRTWAKTGVSTATYTKEGKEGRSAGWRHHSNASSPARQEAKQERSGEGRKRRGYKQARQCERSLPYRDIEF